MYLDISWKSSENWLGLICRALVIIDTACIVCGKVYVTAWCLSFCLSFQLSTAVAACGEFAAVGPAGRRYRSTAARLVPGSNGAAAARRSAANASSVALTAAVGGGTPTCFIRVA